MRQKVFENGLLDGFAFGRGLDDQVAAPQVGQRQRGGNAVQGGVAVWLADLLAADLAIQVTPDQGHGGIQAFLGNVSHHNVIARKRANMRDAVAHLARADDTD